jgi:pyruvate/2-oxoglutarate/acetoin dehydrogenase E1 component
MPDSLATKGKATRSITYVDAVCQALHEEMARDPKVFIMGEDARLGGPFGLTRGLVSEFGEARVRDTPISEAAFAGAAIGAALGGWRPVVDLMFGTFTYCAMDQLCNQAAKWRYMTGGQAMLPIVYRALTGAMGGAAAQHSACVHSLFLQISGLKVIVPSSPYDAKGLLKSAIRDPNPVLMFDSGRLLSVKGEVPTDEFIIPFGQCAIKREGTDVTIVAIGYMVREALASAEMLAEDGISAEVIDPRTLVPLDIDTIIESVRKTRHLVVVDESTPSGSAASEIISLTAEGGFEYLDAPPRKVCSANTPIPFSPILEQAVLPNPTKIADAVRGSLLTNA